MRRGKEGRGRVGGGGGRGSRGRGEADPEVKSFAPHCAATFVFVGKQTLSFMFNCPIC